MSEDAKILKSEFVFKKPTNRVHFSSEGYSICMDEEDLSSLVLRGCFNGVLRSALMNGDIVGIHLGQDDTNSHSIVLNFIDTDGCLLGNDWIRNLDVIFNETHIEMEVIDIIKHNKRDPNAARLVFGHTLGDGFAELIAFIVDYFNNTGYKFVDTGKTTLPALSRIVQKSNVGSDFVKNDYAEFLAGGFMELSQLSELRYGFGVCTDQEPIIEVINDMTAIMARRGMAAHECIQLTNYSDGEEVMRFKQAPKDTFTMYIDNDHMAASYKTNDTDESKTIIRSNREDIACILADYLNPTVTALGLKMGMVVGDVGNSTTFNYIARSYEIKVSKPGIPNFIKMAKEFDVGVYCTVFGQTSVVFSPAFKQKLALQNAATQQTRALQIMNVLGKLYETKVPDPLVNLIALRAILRGKDALDRYTKTHSRVMVVDIKGRCVITAGKQIVEPAAVNRMLENQMIRFHGKVFVGPCPGRKQGVIVVAESVKQENCDRLALLSASIVYDNCHGIGPRPEIVHRYD